MKRPEMKLRSFAVQTSMKMMWSLCNTENLVSVILLRGLGDSQQDLERSCGLNLELQNWDSRRGFARRKYRLRGCCEDGE